MDPHATPPSTAHDIGKQRLEALSDGLYAIALTLLVLDLKVPALDTGAGNAELVAALHALAPRALTWLLSFWVMATMWLGQVRSLRQVNSLSPSMARVQLTALAAVSVMPFSTALLSEHAHLPAAAATYSANLLAITLLGALRGRLQIRDAAREGRPLAADLQRHLHWHYGFLVGCSAACLLLAFVVPPWNMLAMLPMLVRPRVARL